MNKDDKLHRDTLAALRHYTDCLSEPNIIEEQLRYSEMIVVLAKKVQKHTVKSARENNLSWNQIALGLGRTRQSTWSKWKRILDNG